MSISKLANKVADDCENIDRMGPLHIYGSSRHRTALGDLAIHLAMQSKGFRRSLPDAVLNSLCDLVRSMNCYYCNLIEGHNTHPIDIERALNKDYSNDDHKRNLQFEAVAHIEVQKWIDSGGLSGRATTRDGIIEIHRRFCEKLPRKLLLLENQSTGKHSLVVPGQLRTDYVQVGRHVPVSPGAVGRFLDRFEEAYTGLGITDSILAAACAHHRLLWIHPFPDGNGRVARLMSHAMLLETLDTGGVWSIARGLARNEENYKSKLMACDLQRRHDLDGRGNLSEEALAEFVRYFLKTCLDQVEFMESLVQPDLLHKRISMWVEEEIRMGTLPPKAGAVLEAILYRGYLPRSEVANFVNISERQARRVTSALMKRGAVASERSRAPLRIAFSPKLASRWFPGLFP